MSETPIHDQLAGEFADASQDDQANATEVADTSADDGAPQGVDDVVDDDTDDDE